MTRPASALTPASYAHCWAGTRSSLLTCWLGVSQVGLGLIRTHPLGNNNQFHEITLNSKVSGLPWREQAMVRPRRAPEPRPGPFPLIRVDFLEWEIERALTRSF